MPAVESEGPLVLRLVPCAGLPSSAALQLIDGLMADPDLGKHLR